MNWEAGAARQRRNVDDDVAELSVSAGLLLVPPALGHGFADRFLVGNLRRVRNEFEPVLRLHLLARDTQMHLALAGEKRLVRVLHMRHDERAVLLDKLRHRRRHLHLVLAVLHRDRDVIDRRQNVRHFERLGRRAVVTERVSGLDRVEAAESYRVALL